METKKKKILFVITKSNWGGAQRYVYDLATNLPKNEFDVLVVSGNVGPLTQKIHEAGIRTVSIENLKRDVSFSDEVRSFFALRRIFKIEKPDIVHLNSSKAGGLGALAARIESVNLIVFTAHGWPFTEKRSALWRAFAYVGSLATGILAHQIICVSDRDLALAQKMPWVGKKSVRIYNGIDSSIQYGTGDVIRNAFPKGVSITGTIGELNHNKNQIALIEQAKKNSDMYVAIVGEGESRSLLEKKIAEYNLGNRVKLFGFLQDREVLRGFDRFALPSLKEGLPYVLLEAKQAGLPIEANRVGGVGEILDAPDMQIFSLARMLENTLSIYRN